MGRLARRDALLSRLAGTRWPYAPLFELLDLDPHADVLDVGAGDGAGLGTLAQRGHLGRAVGLDPQPAPGVQWGEAEALPFPDASFGAVLLVRVLGHVKEPQRALKEAWRALRPGGRLVLASHGSGHLGEFWRAVGRPVSGPGPEQPLRTALQQAGLTALRLDIRCPLTLNVPDAQEMLRSYNLSVPAHPERFPLADALHLTAWVHHKGPGD